MEIPNQIQQAALKKRILYNLGDLPPMPHIVIKAQEIAADPDSSVQEMAILLENDQAIATKILKLANSAYYGFSRKISSIKHACILLGQQTLLEMVRMAALSQLMGKTLKGYGLGRNTLWWHSVAVAVGSRILAERKVPELAEDAFVAGLIHDAGKIIMDGSIDEYQEGLTTLVQEGRHPFYEIEKRVLGFDHAEIAGEVLKIWNIPDVISVAVRYHHHPDQCPHRLLAYIIHTADYIAHFTDEIALLSGVRDGIDTTEHELHDKAMELIGLSDQELNAVLLKIVDAVHRIEEGIHSE